MFAEKDRSGPFLLLLRRVAGPASQSRLGISTSRAGHGEVRYHAFVPALACDACHDE